MVSFGKRQGLRPCLLVFELVRYWAAVMVTVAVPSLVLVSTLLSSSPDRVRVAVWLGALPTSVPSAVAS